MSPREFCLWLNGFFELAGDGVQILSTNQVQIVKRHLALCFKHMDEHEDAADAAKTGLKAEDIAAIKQAIHDGKNLGPRRPPPGDALIRC